MIDRQMSKYPFLFAIAFLLLSCAKEEAKPSSDLSASQEIPSVPSDVETIDTISLELIDTLSYDSLVVPGIPLLPRWPLQYEVWDGHFVMFVDSLSPRVAELTLLSLKDWGKILSANSEQPLQATDTAAHYIEYGLSDWSIPSEEQAKRIRDEIVPHEMNQHLAETHADTMHVKDGSSNARYLCNEAAKTFSLAENTKISTAGAKTKYRLRLVKSQRVARL